MGDPSEKNYVTPQGAESLRAELKKLLNVDRPEVVKVVSWAAGNGDRSENGDYIYGKRKLREIDRRIRFLTKRLESCEVVDPKLQKSEAVVFGATVVLLGEDASGVEVKKTYQIVGVDEADAQIGKISWQSPLARALLGKKVGDEISLKLPRSETLAAYEILEIRFA